MKKIQAGMLDRKGTLEERSSIRDDRGERTGSWGAVKSNVHCYRMDSSGVENNTEGTDVRQTAYGRVKWVVRYLPEAKPTMRFVVEGTIYDIKAVSEPAGTRRQWTILDCQSHD